MGAFGSNNRLGLRKYSILLGGLSLLLLVQLAYAGKVIHLRAVNIQSPGRDWAKVFTPNGGNESVYPHSSTQSTDPALAQLYASLGKRGEFIIQFKDLITEADKQKILSAGGKILRYLPDDSLLVGGAKIAFGNLDFSRIENIVDFAPEYRLSPDFALSVFSEDQVIVIKSFAPNPKVVEELERKHKLGAALLIEDGKYVLAKVPPLTIEKLAHVSGVEFIQPYVPFTNFVMDLRSDDFLAEPSGGSTSSQPGISKAGDYSDLNGYETGVKVLNAQGAWDVGMKGEGQIVAMADTGLDSGNLLALHEDFQGAVAGGYIFGVYSKDWADPMGHGTHVAGSILGRGTASGGLNKGVAYQARLIVEGMWSPMLENLTVPPKLEKLFQAAYNEGARIHSNSWGSPRNLGAYDSFANQVDEFIWTHPDMLVVFAAGNSGEDKNKDGRIDSGSVSSPGTAKNVLTVGASENLNSTGGIQVPIKKLRGAADKWGAEPILSDFLSDNPNGVAMFSSRGPTLDNRIKPEILGPGTNILSVRSQVKGASELWGAYNADYAYSGGTSMAAPLVAGGATLIRQYLLKELAPSTPSAALLKAAILVGGVEIFPGQFGEVGKDKGQEILTLRPNSDEGYGRMDVTRVLELGLKLVDNKEGVAQGQEVIYEFQTSKEDGDLNVVLVWKDAPASPTAALTLVNDLDLALIAPNGDKVEVGDHTNNHELVVAHHLKPGSYKIQVRGQRVVQGVKQPFALAYF